MESFGCFEDWTQVKEKLFSVPLGQRCSDCKLLYPQWKPHVCLLNGMGVSHPAFAYSSSPAGNSIRGVLLLLPQEQSIHSGMKKNNVGSSDACTLPPFLSCCFWAPWPFQRQLSSLLHLLLNWIANLETLQWEQAIHFNSVSLLSLPWDQGRPWGNAVSICWLSPLMRSTSGLARSQSYGPSCVWASQGSVTRQNIISGALPTAHGQWLTLPAALDRQTCRALLTIRKNEAGAGSQFWTTCLPTLSTHLLFDKNSSDRSTLQQIAILLRNHGRWMAIGRSTMSCSCRGLQGPDPTVPWSQGNQCGHRPRVCVLIWSDWFFTDCQRWGVRWRGQSGSHISGDNTNQKETLGLSG